MMWKESKGRRVKEEFFFACAINIMKYDFYVFYLMWSSHEMDFTISIL